MKSLHIWHYTTVNTSGVGGVEKHIAGTSHELKKMGHTLHVGTNFPDSFASNHENQKFILHTHGDCWPTFEFLRSIKTQHQNVKWIHICHGNTFERMRACKEYLSLSDWKGFARDGSLLYLCDRIIAVSKHAAAETQKYYGLSKKISVIHNGADTETFKPLHKITTNPFLLFLGRAHDHVKNIDGIMKATSQLYQRHDDVQLWIAPGFEATHPFVKNLGKLDAGALAETMQNCRALVLCSFYEGDPLVVREAMAMGLPIVASDIPGTREALADYENKIFVDPNNLGTIETGIERALYEKDFKPIAHARSWKVVATELNAYYLTLFQ